MTKKLLIVESPAKARTIKKILGPDFIVESSVGHIRDLPRSRFGIDIENNFEPEYVTISGKQKVVSKLKKASKDVSEIYLAADPDREGEAICWHLQHYLSEASKAKIHRILYYEITSQAILNSLNNPIPVDECKVNAQQARRVLDRIVGYRLSPFLWKKVRRGLSAGRVQSVALKLIVDREREIDAFNPEEYWTILLNLEAEEAPAFRASYHGVNGKKAKISEKTACDSILRDIEAGDFIVNSVDRKKTQRKPSAPFITSTLQQEAARRYRFPAKKTMRLAQSLYEGKDVSIGDTHGLITYMRTDSPRISKEAQTQARTYIQNRFGNDYIPGKPPEYQARKNAQEAHEAIRPTSIDFTPSSAKSYLTPDELKLYTMIWERFAASQMIPAILNITTIKVGAGKERTHEFRATGSEIVFEGHYKISGLPRDLKRPEKTNEEEISLSAKNQQLPAVKENEILTCRKIDPDQHFTKPPARYSEASLVKDLESKGIGRPSTYATIMSTIRSNDYTKVLERRFHPTELGVVVVDMLVKSFPNILSAEFTATMENKLTDIENGKIQWKPVIKNFYTPFQKRLKEVEKTIEALNRSSEPAEGVECPECKAGMVIRWGRKGRFLSCERYPDCKGILPYGSSGKEDTKKTGKSLTILLPANCPDCGAPLALKKGRYGLFVSCSKFPKCKGKGPKAEGLPCGIDGCEGKLVQRRRKGHRSFYGCSEYPECTYIFNEAPIPVKCDNCGNTYHGASETNGEITIKCPRCKKILDLSDTSSESSVSSEVTGQDEKGDTAVSNPS